VAASSDPGLDSTAAAQLLALERDLLSGLPAHLTLLGRAADGGSPLCGSQQLLGLLELPARLRPGELAAERRVRDTEIRSKLPERLPPPPGGDTTPDQGRAYGVDGGASHTDSNPSLNAPTPHHTRARDPRDATMVPGVQACMSRQVQGGFMAPSLGCRGAGQQSDKASVCLPIAEAHDPERPPLELKSSDVAAYLAVQQAVDYAAATTKLHHPETVEFWKSAPYLVNFMRGYRVKQALTAAYADEARRRKIGDLVQAPKNGLVHWRDVERYSRVPAANPRLRELKALALDSDQWRALWVPPTLAPYAVTGAFETAEQEQATKTLVFSGWRVVPGAVAALLGYEAERLSANKELNTPQARKRRNSKQLLALRYDKRSGRPQGATTFALVYPSSTLARSINPYALVADDEALPALSAVLAEARKTTRRLVRSLAHEARSSRPDPRWYWAAPMLLDAGNGVDVLKLTRGGEGLRSSWRSHTADTGLEHNLNLVRGVLEGRVPLGAQPHDLADVLARLAVGGPAVCALRALQRVAGNQHEPPATAAILGAARIGWGLRTLFNRSDATSIVRSRPRRQRSTAEHAYWRDVISYCCDGALQGVLDEYVALLAEELAQPGESPDHQLGRIASSAAAAMELQSLRVEIDDPEGEGKPYTTRTLSSKFAVAFGTSMAEDSASVHPEIVRQTFNSPFWPWVLVTTSVGQEGLDFHRYCHSIVHWNVPASPVELEQREGRVQRYKSHAIRRRPCTLPV
jgi:Helicase conserved C-terminal domain